MPSTSRAPQNRSTSVSLVHVEPSCDIGASDSDGEFPQARRWCYGGTSTCLPHWFLGLAALLVPICLGGSAARQPDEKPGPEATKEVGPKPRLVDNQALQDKMEVAPKPRLVDKKTGKQAGAGVKKTVVAAAEDAMAKRIEAQFSGHFKRIFRAEMGFMRMVTNLKKQEYEKIVADSEPALKAALQKFAKDWQRGMNESSDPTAIITDAILKSVTKHLSPEQAAQYKNEIESRIAANKQMAVANLVVMIDKVLFLSSEQRGKLKEVLAKNWSDSWSQTQYFMYDYQWFPPMPDDKINPILTEKQRVAWKGFNKNAVRFGVSFANEAEPDDNENWPEDPPQKAKSDRETLPPPRVQGTNSAKP